MRQKTVSILAISIAIFAQSLSQSEIDSKSGELDNIRNEIESFKESVSQKKQEEQKTVQKINRVEEEIALTTKMVRALDRENKKREKEIILKSKSIEEKEAQHFVLQGRLNNRLRRMYVTKKKGIWESLLDRTKSISVIAKLKYLQVLAEYDARLTIQVLTAKSKLTTEQHDLVILQKKKQELLSETKQNEHSLKFQQSQKELFLKKIKNDKNALQELVAQKEESAQLLTNLIRELERQKREADLGLNRGKVKFIPNVPFSSLRGKLPWPATGRVIQKFGKIKNLRYNTDTESLGIDISVKVGTPVRCVSDGRVANVTYMRRFGNVVLIDHSDGYYSIYGHLNEVQVSKGMIIRAGESLGPAGETGSIEGPKVYFAVWTNDQYLNPEKWLNK